MDLPRLGPVPTVGAMKGYGQFCPVAVAAEIFAERWTPLILRELFAGERRFNDIRRGVPLISRSLLAARLRELEDAGLLGSRPLLSGRGREYKLTPAGEELRAVVDGLGAWGQRWVTGQFDPENLDVSVLMWNVRRRIDKERLPAHRVVVRFDFRALPPHYKGMRTWWLILDRPEIDLCLKDPGFDVDVVVSAEAATMARVWMGQVEVAQAVRAGAVRLEGAHPLVQALPGWLLLSHFAHVERPAHAD
jgi:DNA-binding HxlR family transcriptional regulator